MSLRTLRRTLLALALVAPVTAAHPTKTTPPAPAAAGAEPAFEGEFAGYSQLPAAPVAGGPLPEGEASWNAPAVKAIAEQLRARLTS